jgi:hypothetical protein
MPTVFHHVTTADKTDMIFTEVYNIYCTGTAFYEILNYCSHNLLLVGGEKLTFAERVSVRRS